MKERLLDFNRQDKPAIVEDSNGKLITDIDMDIKPNEIINIILDNGHISLHRYSDNPSEIILSSLFVRKQRQNGNGTNLMLLAEQIAKGLGCVCVFLEARKGSWQEKWYVRLGYNYCEYCQERSGLIWMKKNLEK